MNKTQQNATGSGKLKNLPSIDIFLKHNLLNEAIETQGASLVKNALKKTLDTLRKDIIEKGDADISPENIAGMCLAMIDDMIRPRLARAVNATGIILHTGLGRAPIPPSAAARLQECAQFCNLQTDIDSGKRSRREANLLDHVKALTGAEDAVAVNNNAGATMLVLKALARNREVVVSRGELIEIGGSFRLPDIMKESGAILHEVGSTNKTHLRDYEEAVNENTAVLFKAHKSNYSIVGFSKDVSISEIAGVGRKHGITVVDDLGCGALINTEDYGLPHETTVRESLAAGADIALFSTDKLIGGPQGGLIVGRSELISKIRKDPMYRILRICKLTLSALEATLLLFRKPEMLNKCHPLYAALSRKPDGIRAQADRLQKAVSAARPSWNVHTIETISVLGGGSLPGSELKSWGIALNSDTVSAEKAASALRKAQIPVFGRIEKDLLILDMRTVTEQEEEDLLKAVATI